MDCLAVGRFSKSIDELGGRQVLKAKLFDCSKARFFHWRFPATDGQECIGSRPSPQGVQTEIFEDLVNPSISLVNLVRFHCKIVAGDAIPLIATGHMPPPADNLASPYT